MTPKWVDLIEVADLEKGDVTYVEFDGRAIALYDAADRVYSTSATCTHGGANLCDGYFDGQIIECPLHQGYFDIATGAALGAPATTALKTYECDVVGGQVRVLIDSK